MSLLRRALQKLPGQSQPDMPQIAPDPPFVAIGDIHGRKDLLDQLLLLLDAKAPSLPRVFLGDYIDRGPNAQEVLETLMHMTRHADVPTICLRGNHEAMCTAFLQDPETDGPMWLRNGGTETLQSFGLDAESTDLTNLRDHFVETAGPDVPEWLEALPSFWQSGNVWVSHAGGDPSLTPTPGRDHGLIWGHPKLKTTRRVDEHWMVHGHYTVPTATSDQGRIAIDTGAWQSNTLTAAIIRPGQIEFVST